MITVNAILIEYLGHDTPQIKIISRGDNYLYRTFIWPADKPLNRGQISVEVAKLWRVKPSEIVILDNITLP